MNIIPSKLLRVNFQSVVEEDVEDLGNYFYSAWSWRVTLGVIAQIHGNPDTPTPYEYNGFDVKVGDWIADWQLGYAWKIVEIYTSDYYSLEVKLEDVDRFNRVNDSTGNLSGSPATYSVGHIFELDDSGLPILNPLPQGIVEPQWQGNLISRFFQRNPHAKFLQVDQPGHGMTIGDQIYLDTDGSYKRIAASREFKDIFDKIIGFVTQVGIPNVDSFHFKPKGSIVKSADLGLPILASDLDEQGHEIVPGWMKSRGLPIYLDSVNAGRLTLTKPSKYAMPVYIHLHDGINAIYISGGGGGGTSGPLGYYTSTYKVDTIVERNALPAADLEIGDQCWVANDGHGRWAEYTVTAKDVQADTVTWTLKVNETASDTDAESSFYLLDFDTSETTPIISYVAQGTRVFMVTVEVVSAFSVDATLDIGDDGSNTRLMSDSEIDLSSVGTYAVYPSYLYDSPGYTAIKAFFSKGTSGSGQAKIVLSYV